MSNTLQIRRGANADLPTLNAGELGFSTDTHQVYVGSGAANYELWKVGDMLPASYKALAVADLTDSATPSVLTTAETTGRLISNYKSSGADHVFTMPAAHIYGNVIFIVGDEFQIDIEPNAGDLFYLNGTAMAANEHIQNTADTLGDTITGYCANINGTLRWMFKSDNANFVEETP